MEKSAAIIVIGIRATKTVEVSRTMKDQITKEAARLHICKSDEASEDNGTRHLDNPDGRRDASHLTTPGSGGTPRKVR